MRFETNERLPLCDFPLPAYDLIRLDHYLMALGLFERAEDQTFVPTKELREVEIDRALRLHRQGTAGLL
jgi:hypothetical protein